MLLSGYRDGVPAIVALRSILRRAVSALLLLIGIAASCVWLVGSRNPYTPAGYAGYLTKGAVFGQSRYYGVQQGPAAPATGRPVSPRR